MSDAVSSSLLLIGRAAYETARQVRKSGPQLLWCLWGCEKWGPRPVLPRPARASVKPCVEAPASQEVQGRGLKGRGQGAPWGRVGHHYESTFRAAMNALSQHATCASGAMLAHTIAKTASSKAARSPCEDDARHIHGGSAADGLIAPAAKAFAARSHVLPGSAWA
jgi:hypothetical protein